VFKLGQSVPGISRAGGTAPVLNFPDGLTAVNPGGGGEGSYNPLLPYPTKPEDSQVELPTEDEEEASGGASGGAFNGGDAPGDERTPQLAYVAGALLSAVVAAHVLWLRGEVLRPDDGELLPVAPPPPPPPAPLPVRVFEPPPPPSRRPPPPPVPAGPSRLVLFVRPDASR